MKPLLGAVLLCAFVLGTGCSETEQNDFGIEATSAVVALGANDFAHNADRVYLRGDMNDWSDEEMVLVGDNLWSIDVLKLDYNQENFNIVTVTGEKSVVLGRSEDNWGYAQEGGELLTCYSNGVVRITFNDNTLEYQTDRVRFESKYEYVSIAGNGRSSGLVKIGDHKWAGTLWFGPAGIDLYRFGIVATTSDFGDERWGFGDTDLDGIMEEGGDGIIVEEDGVYEIYFYEDTNEYTLVRIGELSYESKYANMFVRGSFNDWKTIPMQLQYDNSWVALIDIRTPSEQSLKFDADGDWTVNFGDSGENSYAYAQSATGGTERNGANIGIPSSTGQYLVEFREDDEYSQGYYQIKKVGDWNSRFSTVSLLGSCEPASSCRAHRVSLELLDEHTWRGFVEFRHGAYPVFQILAGSPQGEESVVYGDADGDGVAEKDGAKIPVATPGIYSVSVNDNTMRYTVSQVTSSTITHSNDLSGYYYYGKNSPGYVARRQSVYYRGSTNDWSTSPMTLIGDHLWEIDVLVLDGDNAGFKFDLSGGWNHSYGDDEGDGVCDESGDNIQFSGPGQYNITFNDETRVYTVNKRGKANYGKLNVDIKYVSVKDGELIETPVEYASVCSGWDSFAQYCYTDRGTSTDEDGRATLDLPAGKHDLQVTKFSGYIPTTSRLEVLVEAGQEFNQTVRLATAAPCFDVYADPGYGRALYITGQSEFLGNWKTAYKMTYVDGHWTRHMAAPVGLKYKIVLADWVDGATISTEGVAWENGDNHTIIGERRLDPRAGYYCDKVYPGFEP